MKVNKILISLLVAMLLVTPALAFDVPTPIHLGNQIWLEDQFGSSDIYYDTKNATIGTVFNVIMYVNTSLAKVGAWQFQMYFDSSWLEVLSCVYSGTGNTRSQFFEEAGTNNVFTAATIGPGSLLHAESWSSGPYPGDLTWLTDGRTGKKLRGASVAYITFRITKQPDSLTPKLYSVLDIYTNPNAYAETYFQDENGTKYQGIGCNGVVTFALALSVVGGYSVPIEKYAGTGSMVPYFAFVAMLTATFAVLRRKKPKRK